MKMLRQTRIGKRVWLGWMTVWVGLAIMADGAFTPVQTFMSELQLNRSAWTDSDNDGDYDLLLNAFQQAVGFHFNLWQNDGAAFQKLDGLPPGIGLHSIVPGDFDRDGRVDFVICRHDGVVQLWINQPSGFAVSPFTLGNPRGPTIARGDYDNDGDLDFLSFGTGFVDPIQLWRNTPAGFQARSTGITSQNLPTVGDFDGDNDLDMISDSDGQLRLWYNDGRGAFVDSGVALPALQGSLLAADLDSDGDLDVLTYGRTSGSITAPQQSRFLRNDGAGFSVLSALPDELFPLSLVDYDNDGDLDLIVLVFLPDGPQAKLFLNSSGSFADSGLAILDSASGPWLGGWADYDNDGDQDLLLGHRVGPSMKTQLWRNDAAPLNTPPSIPSGLTATVVGGEVLLGWNPASDTQTPSAGLTYNLQVGTTPGGFDVISPESAASGFRRIPSDGNAGQGLSARLLLPIGTYFWSVQAVDSAWAGGGFSEERSFVVAEPLPVAITSPASTVGVSTATLNGEVNPLGSPTTVWFEWGTTTSYGQTTAVQTVSGPAALPVSQAISGLGIETTYHYRLVATNTAGTATGADATFTTQRFIPGPAFPPGFFVPGIPHGGVAWGDYDLDGNLDLVVGGKLLRNAGGVFSEVATPWPSRNYVNSWGDFDGDGDLDIVMSSGGSTEVWRNIAGVFVSTSVVLPGSDGWTTAWGDFDNDGDLDLVITGNAMSGDRAQILRNENGSFVHVQAQLPSFANPRAEWIDFDGDGDLDLALNGYDTKNGRAATIIARNDSGTFILLDVELPGINFGSLAWGDYDGDGDADVALRGFSTGSRSLIWRNDGVGVFVPVGPDLGDSQDSSLAWGDYDNDGDLDLLVGGFEAGVYEVDIFRNDASSFRKTDSGITGFYPVSWADFDNDGDLDILARDTLWRNQSLVPNSTPGIPSSLSSEILPDRVRLSWTHAVDAESASASLTYNLRVGTLPGAGDVAPPHFSTTTGFRLIPQAGNAQLGNSAFLSLLELPLGTYYWAVQALDASFAAGSFSVESSFVVSEGAPVAATGRASSVSSTEVSVAGRVNTRGLMTRVWFEYGLTTSYGNVTPAEEVGAGQVLSVSKSLSGLVAGETYHYRIRAENSAGAFFGEDRMTTTPYFTLVSTLPIVGNSVASWGDFDADGDLDLAILSAGVRIYGNHSGSLSELLVLPESLNWTPGAIAWSDHDNDSDLDLMVSPNSIPNTPPHVWSNEGGTLTKIDLSLPIFSFGELWPGDFDNDGSMDLMFGRETRMGNIVEVWIQRNGGFSLIPNGPGFASSFQAFPGDYDRDGDLDLLVKGWPKLGPLRFTRLFRNDQGVFVDSEIAFPSIVSGSSAWGDFDMDGDLDLAISGMRPDEGYVDGTIILRNDGTTFQDIGVRLPPSQQLGWADFDGDGRLDLCLAAGSGIWRNNGGNAFTELLTGFVSGRFAYADYDRDGDLDILVGGKLWRNDINHGNHPPSAPTGLRHEIAGDRVLLNWDPSMDSETRSPGLAYNLRVGTAPGQGDIVESQSDPATGFLKVISPLGLRSAAGSYLNLNSLPSGVFHWSVQAVDATGSGGPWAAGQSFTVTDLEGDVGPRLSGIATVYGDRRLTISDWVQAGRFVAGLDPIPSTGVFQRIDCAPRTSEGSLVLGDGRITIADWVQAGRYAAGLDTVAPSSGPTELAP